MPTTAHGMPNLLMLYFSLYSSVLDSVRIKFNVKSTLALHSGSVNAKVNTGGLIILSLTNVSETST